MLTYKKYIAKTIIAPFATLTIVLTTLGLITQTLRMLHLIDKGIRLKYFLKLVMLLVPSLLFTILPIISVVTVIFVYSNLQEESQLIILRNIGISNYGLIKPALSIATAVTIFAIYISAHLMPLSYSTMREEILNFREGYISNIIDNKTFNQISKYSNIYVKNKNSDGSLSGIILFDNKIPQNRTILFAKYGKIITIDSYKTEFELQDGVKHSYDKLGNLTKLYFDNLRVNIKNENLNNKNRRKIDNELYIHEMLWPNSSLSFEKQQRMITDGHLRIIWPLFNFAFVFLALSVFLNQPYSRRAHIKQYIITFIPILVISYFHFMIQKIAYKNLNYIFLCYINVSSCIIFSIWQSTKRSL